jgi:CelD/BcsL family acetyltransferase involved in cellulose biosynthesis
MSAPQLPGRTDAAAYHPGVSARVASDLRIERIASLEDLDRVREEWDGFVEQSGSDIYFTVDWLQAWWTHYGRGRAFHGFILWDGARMVGVLPFSVQRVWAGPVTVRLAKFVGADSTLPVFTPAVADGFEESVVRAALELLFDDAGCDAVSLSPLSGLSRVPEAAERAAAGDTFRLVRSDSPGVHTVFNLPGSFDEYLRSLSSSQRKSLRRYLRKLNSRHEISQSQATRRSRTSTGSRSCTPPTGANGESSATSATGLRALTSTATSSPAWRREEGLASTRSLGTGACWQSSIASCSAIGATGGYRPAIPTPSWRSCASAE